LTATSARPDYPFTAIVGQPQMRLALLLHAVNPALGGVLVRGRKGTAKSTAVRALAGLLPDLDTVEGCPFGCDPTDAIAACDDCAPRIAAGEALPGIYRRVPVVELPIGATEDRVAGSLNLEVAIQSGERRFEPGLLARANRGILYMDEVNLLGDHLVDLLLDAAAMGRNYVEREGMSVSHPARVMLIGTMNPEEGELRPQLLDRFALAVDVDGLHDPAERAAAVRNRIAYEADPASFARSHLKAEADERDRLGRARDLLPKVSLSDGLLGLITHICTAFEVDGLRADLAMYRVAVSLAAYRGRELVSEEDVREVAPLVLAHRRRRQPFEQPGMDPQQLDGAIAGYQSTQDGNDQPAGNDGPPEGDNAGAAEPAPGHGRSTARASQPAGQRENPNPAHSAQPSRLSAPAGEHWTAPGKLPPSFLLPAAPDRARSESTGRRLSVPLGRRGGTAHTLPPKGPVRELAVAATLAAAAPYQQVRRSRDDNLPAIALHRDDLRERVRRGRTGSLMLFVLDASGSMGARERMASTKAAVLGLLLDAYRKRDQVGMVVFKGQQAELVLPPTNSVELAERRLTSLSTGGRTPLAAGLETARATVERALRWSQPIAPILILVSDGRANSAPPGVDPLQAARYVAETIRSHGWRTVVLDTESGRAGTGFARGLSGWLGAEYMRLDAGRLQQRYEAD